MRRASASERALASDALSEYTSVSMRLLRTVSRNAGAPTPKSTARTTITTINSTMEKPLARDIAPRISLCPVLCLIMFPAGWPTYCDVMPAACLFSSGSGIAPHHATVGVPLDGRQITATGGGCASTAGTPGHRGDFLFL